MRRGLFLSGKRPYLIEMAKLPANTVGFMTRSSGRAAGGPRPRIDNRTPEVIPPEHREAVREGIDQANRGEFATDSEMKAAFRRFGP